MWTEEELKVGTLSNGTVENSDLYIFYHTFIFPTNIFSSPPLRKLIFGHYISSFPPSYHTSSGITQITFLNAPSKSPYKQMQSLTRNNHITSNHLPLLLFTPSKDIFIRTFSIVALFSHPAEPHLCATLHQRYKVRGRAQMLTSKLDASSLCFRAKD